MYFVLQWESYYATLDNSYVWACVLLRERRARDLILGLLSSEKDVESVDLVNYFVCSSHEKLRVVVQCPLADGTGE